MLTKYSRFSMYIVIKQTKILICSKKIKENIIFKWYDFSVSGVKHVYDVTDGEKQGEIGDF